MSLLTPNRVIFIVLAVGLTLNVWMVYQDSRSTDRRPPASSSTQSINPTQDLKSLLPQHSRAKETSTDNHPTQNPMGTASTSANSNATPATRANSIDRDTLITKAHEGAKNFCNTRPLNGLSVKACLKFVQQQSSRCLAQARSQLPEHFANIESAIPHADGIIECLLPPIAIPEHPSNQTR